MLQLICYKFIIYFIVNIIELYLLKSLINKNYTGLPLSKHLIMNKSRLAITLFN